MCSIGAPAAASLRYSDYIGAVLASEAAGELVTRSCHWWRSCDLARYTHPSAGEGTGASGSMDMAAVWTLPERRLVIELATGIARRLSLILVAAANRVEPGYVFHGFTSDFERGCIVLWRLGVAHAAYGPEPGRKGLTPQTIVHDEGFPPYFKFLAPFEIRDLLSSDTPVRTPSLHEILCAYLSVACQYGPPGSLLSSRQEAFIPQQEYASEIDALEILGYVERRGTAVLWTNKMTLPMQDAYLWNADGQSSDAVAEAALKDECAAVLDLTPEHTKRLLAREAKRMSELDFVILLRDRFDGLYLRKNPDGTLRPQTGGAGFLRAVYWQLRTHL